MIKRGFLNEPETWSFTARHEDGRAYGPVMVTYKEGRHLRRLYRAEGYDTSLARHEDPGEYGTTKTAYI